MTHLLLAFLLFISACSSTQTERIDAEIEPDSSPDKILEGYSTGGGLERDGQLLMIKGEKARQTESEVKEWLRKLKMI